MKAPSRTLIIVMAAPLAVLAGCGGSGTSSPSATSPIAIGYELPLTGTVALPGKQEQEGWNLGLKEFGQSVDGHRIVTYFEDTGGNPAVALSDARSLVQQKHIQLMEGPLLASEDAAVARISARSGCRWTTWPSARPPSSPPMPDTATH
jgi:ABC-type branched-subunit amino acid transport system substrate-binding protein